MEREYRAVGCTVCIWQDYYEIGRRTSYAPRCPACGALCDHEFFVARFPRSVRSRLGRDAGIRSIFGDPIAGYKNMRDRMRRRNYPAKMFL